MLSYRMFGVSQYFPVHFTDLVLTRTLIYNKIWNQETVTNDIFLQFNLTLRDSDKRPFSGFDTFITLGLSYHNVLKTWSVLFFR